MHSSRLPLHPHHTPGHLASYLHAFLPTCSSQDHATTTLHPKDGFLGCIDSAHCRTALHLHHCPALTHTAHAHTRHTAHTPSHPHPTPTADGDWPHLAGMALACARDTTHLPHSPRARCTGGLYRAGASAYLQRCGRRHCALPLPAARRLAADVHYACLPQGLRLVVATSFSHSTPHPPPPPF